MDIVETFVVNNNDFSDEILHAIESFLAKHPDYTLTEITHTSIDCTNQTKWHLKFRKISSAPVLQLPEHVQSKEFMTPEQYRVFSERFQQQVRPELDRQREARIRSEEQARKSITQ